MPNETLTREEYDRWLTPKLAATAFKGIWSYDTAQRELFERLKLGLIRSVADLCIIFRNDAERNRRTLTVIDPQEWNTYDGYSDDSHFWNTGSISMSHSDFRDQIRSQYLGICFDPAHVEDLIKQQRGPPAVSLLSATEPVKHAGGAPPKAFWDDLWIEMFRRIHFGEFSPKRPADIQKAMAVWIENAGFSAGETTLKGAARKLFDALQEGQ